MTSEQKKFLPFHEDSFVKVYLSFAIISSALSICIGLFGSTVQEPTWLVLNVIGGIAGLIGIATFVMSIVAWVQWHKRAYPKVAVMFAMTHTILPVVFAAIGIIMSVMWFAKNAASFENLEPGETPDLTSMGEMPILFSVMNWVSIAVAIGFIAWAIYLFTLKEDKKEASKTE